MIKNRLENNFVKNSHFVLNRWFSSNQDDFSYTNFYREKGTYLKWRPKNHQKDAIWGSRFEDVCIDLRCPRSRATVDQRQKAWVLIEQEERACSISTQAFCRWSTVARDPGQRKNVIFQILENYVFSSASISGYSWPTTKSLSANRTSSFFLFD